METFGQPVRFQPVERLREKELALRLRLIAEELQELGEAFGIIVKIDVESGDTDDLLTINKYEALDALTDLRYVVYGAFHTLGLANAADPAFDEVQRSNMSKGRKCEPCRGTGIVGEHTLDEGPTTHACDKCNGYGVLPSFNEHGKILKGPHYFKPDLVKVMSELYPPRPAPDAVNLGGPDGMTISR